MAGKKSLLAVWMGGAAAAPAVVVSGMRSMLAFWMGGARGSVTPVVIPAPQPSGGGTGRGNHIDYYELAQRRRLKQQREEEEVIAIISAFLATRKAA